MRNRAFFAALLALAAPLTAQSLGTGTTPAQFKFQPNDTPDTRLRKLEIIRKSVASGGSSAGVSSFNTRTGAVTLTSGDVTTALTFTPAQASHTHAYTDVVSVPTGSLLYRKTAGTGAAEMQSLATLKSDLGLTGTNSGDQTITLTGDVTGSGTGSFATAIGANKVTRGMLSATAGAAFLGATAAGNVADLTGTQATTLLDAFTSTLKGLAPASGGGTTNFLRADGTWAAPPGGGSGTVTSVSVTSANGVSGTVTNPTTTPAISLALGAITPTSVAATSTVTGSNLSGTNTGDETSATVLSKLAASNIATSGSILSSGTAGVGYSTGNGGTVTQATSRTTGVVLNKICGEITLFSTTTTAGLSQTFNVTDSFMTPTDVVILNLKNNPTANYILTARNKGTTGLFSITVYTPAAASAEAPVISFCIIKGTNA